METLRQDIRYAVRLIKRSPGFTAIAALTIALGIGPTTTIFSIANALLIRTPPGVRNPERLVSMYASSDFSRFATFSYPTFEDYRDGPNGLSGIAALDVFQASLSTGTGGEPEMVGGIMVSASYFTILGTRPAVGRFFLAEEDVLPNAHPVAVLSHREWTQRFGADTSVIGRAVTINRSTFTVVGVAEEGFQGHAAGFDFGVFIPLAMRESITGVRLDDRGTTSLVAIGRLADGWTIEQARSAMSATTVRLEREYPDLYKAAELNVVPYSALLEEAQQPVQIIMALLLAVSGVVLVIASVNVASMLLARATVRTREIAVRLAIGAGKARLIRQLLTESVLLFLLGGLAGAILTIWSTGALSAINLPVPFPFAFDFAPDLRVLGFTLALTCATGVISGLAPAFQATGRDLAAALKATRGHAPGGRLRMRNLLVVAQISGSVVLLVAAGMFLRALARADSVDLGFEPQNVHVLSVDLGLHRYSRDEGVAFYRELQERASALPGVQSTALSTMLPFGYVSGYQYVTIPGREPAPGQGGRRVGVNTVSPRYFESLGIELLAGRHFDESDREGSPGVVIINESAARQLWPGENALGKQIQFGSAQFEVVGIARNSKYHSLADRDRPMVYRAFAQTYDAMASLVVRTIPGAQRVDRPVREIALALDPDLPVIANAPYEQIIGLSLLPNRVTATAVGALGSLGLILAAVGLFGLLSYAVSQRTHEIGVRLALGADNIAVHRLVLGHGLRLTAFGLAIGMPLAFAAAYLIRGLLFGLSPADPVTFGSIALLLTAVGALASLVPARRATRTDPLNVLRSE